MNTRSQYYPPALCKGISAIGALAQQRVHQRDRLESFPQAPKWCATQITHTSKQTKIRISANTINNTNMSSWLKQSARRPRGGIYRVYYNRHGDSEHSCLGVRSTDFGRSGREGPSKLCHEKKYEKIHEPPECSRCLRMPRMFFAE